MPPEESITEMPPLPIPPPEASNLVDLYTDLFSYGWNKPVDIVATPEDKGAPALLEAMLESNPESDGQVIISMTVGSSEIADAGALPIAETTLSESTLFAQPPSSAPVWKRSFFSATEITSLESGSRRRKLSAEYGAASPAVSVIPTTDANGNRISWLDQPIRHQAAQSSKTRSVPSPQDGRAGVIPAALKNGFPPPLPTASAHPGQKKESEHNATPRVSVPRTRWLDQEAANVHRDDPQSPVVIGTAPFTPAAAPAAASAPSPRVRWLDQKI